MFSDNHNTYLYNTLTGEVYIKYPLGRESYEDVFVKMPKGVASKEELKRLQQSPNEPSLKNPSHETPDSSKKESNNTLHKLQSLQNLLNGDSLGDE